jgi:hypothetical protein
MEQFQDPPIPESQKKFMSQLAHDFRAAISYVSFYPVNSSFVTQSVQKLYKDFQKILHHVQPLYIHAEDEKLYINDFALSPLDDLLRLFQDRNIQGVEIIKDISLQELTAWLQVITFPFEENAKNFKKNQKSNIRPFSKTESEPTPEISEQSLSVTLPSSEFPATLVDTSSQKIDDGLERNRQALLGFVAEAWQFSQIQRRTLGASTEMAHLLETFDQLFNRLLDRMEKTSPDFKNIYAWFKNPTGDFLSDGEATSMYPLLEIAINNGWPSVLFDPATEGLVSDCLTYWANNNQQDLIEKAVFSLADGLKGNPMERQLALTHLMDARPWVKNAKLVEKVLDQLNGLIASEIYPGTYQSALLLAWDLVEAALDLNKEQPVLTLLATLHFQADDEMSSFPECSSIARHWLYERSTPELIRRLVNCAYRAGKLNHFPLLGEMAGPLLLEDFFETPLEQKDQALNLLYEMREAVRSALVEWLAGAEEAKIPMIFPVLRSCGLDAPLALQLSSWIAQGSQKLKSDLITLIAEINDPVGALALRSALLDDSEEIAVQAALVVGKVHFTPAIQMLLKTVKLRESHSGSTDAFVGAICQTLGELGQSEAIHFLEDVAKKKSILRNKNFSNETRLHSIEALAKIDQPESWRFLNDLRKEENPALKDALDKIMREKTHAV